MLIKLLNFALIFCVISCSSMNYNRVNDFQIAQRIKYKEYDMILKEYELRIKEDNSDLLTYMNYAFILSYSNRYNESNEVIQEIKDNIYKYYQLSIKSKIKQKLINEESIKYRLTPNEEILLYSLSIINNLALNKEKEALIDAKDMNNWLELYQKNNIINKKDSFFANYLSAMTYELNNKFNDSLIDYKRVYAYNENFPYTKFDLVKNSLYYNNDKLGYAEKFNIDKEKIDFDSGQISIFYMNGTGPLKIENPNYPNVPKYVTGFATFDNIKIYIDNEYYGEMLDFINIDELQINYLKSKHKNMVINDITRILVKESILVPLDFISLGSTSILNRLIAHSMNKEDFRYAKFIPKEIKLMKINLNAGSHKIKIVYPDNFYDIYDVVVRKNKNSTIVIKKPF